VSHWRLAVSQGLDSCLVFFLPDLNVEVSYKQIWRPRDFLESQDEMGKVYQSIAWFIGMPIKDLYSPNYGANFEGSLPPPSESFLFPTTNALVTHLTTFIQLCK
jgi:hypothetical protein